MAGDDSRARPPRDFVIEGDWPAARLADHSAARVAQQIASRLARVMAERGLSAKRLGIVSGVDRRTVASLLNGMVWTDMMTIANLEDALDVQLWPRRPDAPGADTDPGAGAGAGAGAAPLCVICGRPAPAAG